MNILRTFETFWTLPKKLFNNKQIKVVHIEQEYAQDAQAEPVKSIFADVTDKEITMNVYNSQKTYSLLTSVLYKKKMLNENKDGEIYNECTFA